MQELAKWLGQEFTCGDKHVKDLKMLQVTTVFWKWGLCARDQIFVLLILLSWIKNFNWMFMGIKILFWWPVVFLPQHSHKIHVVLLSKCDYLCSLSKRLHIHASFLIKTVKSCIILLQNNYSNAVCLHTEWGWGCYSIKYVYNVYTSIQLYKYNLWAIGNLILAVLVSQYSKQRQVSEYY